MFQSPLCANVLSLLLAVYALAGAGNLQAQSAPEFLSYVELQELYAQKTPSAGLQAKLNRLLTTPFLDNSGTSMSRPRLSQSSRLNEFLRVAAWNIERGVEYEAIEAVLADESKLSALLDVTEFPVGGEARRKILEQAMALRAADVIVLTEVDNGTKRAGYRDIARDLARRLGMNYAFGVQFIELSPVALSDEPLPGDAEENEILQEIRVDRERYRGLHGVAILSRFPLADVRLAPFGHQPYDWYESEKKGVSLLEKGKREVSKRVFLERTIRQVRRGGRAALYADLVDPRFPGGRITVAAAHLENRAKPSGRVQQLQEMLSAIRDLNHPVILAGDMNTSTEDLTPTSLKRELAKRYGNPKFWAKKAASYALGFGFIEDLGVTALTFGRKLNDPTVRHIPFFSPNPGERFFRTLKNFRFADGGAFDFRGDRTRSFGGNSKTLANSNQRGAKGFVTTYRVERPLKILGKYKLDWIFVKPADLKKPTDKKGSYRFAPHFGRTLDLINEVIEHRISDHRPLLVDLPLGVPSK